jgi:poly-gamma-glutamate capsule biosynthesis protein CapA/YwtB (metallophosphatase superfamily)
MTSGNTRGTRSFGGILFAFALPFFLAGCGSSTLAVSIDPRAADSFLALCQDHPLPAGIAYRYLDASRSSSAASVRLYFGKAPKGKNERSVSAYRLYPVKYCWERKPAERRFLPLSRIELPTCIWIDGMAGQADDDELILSIGPDAPRALREWFDAIPTSEPASIAWIAAVGDLMMGRGIEGLFLSGPEGGRKVFGDTLPILSGADFLLGNLEGALTEGGSRAVKSYTFRFPRATAAALKETGFDYVSLSNNHSFDFGDRGFIDSLKAVKAAGLGCSGAGMNLSAAVLPFRAALKGQELSLTAFGAYRLELPRASVAASASRPGILLKEEGLAAIRASAGTAFDIAVAHAGTEYADAPDRGIRGLYHACVDSGADLVLGSHPHVLQGIEVYRGRLIVYSLGNFVFRGMDEEANATDTMILRLGLSGGRVVAVEPVFAKIGDDGPRLAPASSGDRFYALSRALAGLADCKSAD